METASKAVTSFRRRSNIEKSTWRTHRYFVNFKSRIYVKIFTSNRCHNFHMDSPFKLMKSRRKIHVEFLRQIGESTKMCPLGSGCGTELKSSKFFQIRKYFVDAVLWNYNTTTKMIYNVNAHIPCSGFKDTH